MSIKSSLRDIALISSFEMGHSSKRGVDEWNETALNESDSDDVKLWVKKSLSMVDLE